MSKAPAQILAKMRNTVLWERYTGQDEYTLESYAAPVTLRCWLEEKGGFGGVQRKATVGVTEMDPKVDVYMDAQDVDAAEVTMRDRFTVTVNGQNFTTQADRINVMFGPDGVSPWLTVVTL